jgi:hypothetical protein
METDSKPSPTGIYILTTLLIIGIFIDSDRIIQISGVITGYVLLRWLSDYRKCTFSYIEVKLRGVKKEQGYIYRGLDSIFNVNRMNDRFYWYFLYFVILFVNMWKLLNS